MLEFVNQGSSSIVRAREIVSVAILAIVFAVELALCADYHERRWNELQELSQGTPGEGLVIRYNGLGYYAWLRSAILDGDWAFDNEFEDHGELTGYSPPAKYRTAIGRRANQWSVGPACAWALIVVPGHVLLKAWHARGGPWLADGYSLPYQLLVGGTSLTVTFLGIILLYKICRFQAGPVGAALAACYLSLGTTIVYYSSIELSLPHGIGATSFAAFVWYWLKTYGSWNPRRWFVVGSLLGVACMIRWQLATFSVLLAMEAGLLFLQRSRTGESFVLRKPVACLILSASGFLLGFLPQLIAWRCVYGSWLTSPIPGMQYHWLTPCLWEILLSEDRSLFRWTPVTVVALVGMFGFLIPCRGLRQTPGLKPTRPCYEPYCLLLLGFGIQVYALASMWGKGDWLQQTDNYGGVFLGRSYGFRDLTESLVSLAPGLALLIERSLPGRFWFTCGIGHVLIFWNLLLVCVYNRGLIPGDASVDFGTLWRRSWDLVMYDPLILLQVLAGPVLVGVIVWFTEERIGRFGDVTGC